MRLCVRLAGVAGLMMAVAIALVYMRTETAQTGNRLHTLYREQRRLHVACCRLELALSGLRRPHRLKREAVFWDDAVGPPPAERAGPPPIPIWLAGDPALPAP
jgi:hypothetical protein